MHWGRFLLCFLLFSKFVFAQDSARTIHVTVVVAAPLDSVWDAWTTPRGITTFFAPACNLELKVNGPYEIFFAPTAPAGQRGAEGMRVMALQPKKMLAFTWNAPPSLPEVRQQLTHVVVRFQVLTPATTQVTLTHDGWGEGGEWEQAFQYFSKAWRDYVLPNLQKRFVSGPIKWQ